MLFFKFAGAGMGIRSVFWKLLRPSEIINLVAAVGRGTLGRNQLSFTNKDPFNQSQDKFNKLFVHLGFPQIEARD